MSEIKYFVYTNTDCTHYDNLDKAIEKYNSVEMQELKDSVFLGIESDDISPTSGICFDIIHKFFKENILINDWLYHADENGVRDTVREIICRLPVTKQFTSNLLNGTFIPFSSPWIKLLDVTLGKNWNEAYITDCSNGEMISIGWKPYTRETFEEYGWNYPNTASFIDRLNVAYTDDNGVVHYADIDPREFLAYHGFKFSDVKDLVKEGE